MNNDVSSQKEDGYWNEFSPLWWEGIKSWFGWGNWKQTMTTLLTFIGTVGIYLYIEEFEWALENIAQFFTAILIGGLWFLFVAIISFISSNITLYKNKQKEIIDRQIEIDRLTKTVELEIQTISDLLPMPLDKSGKKKYLGLEVQNTSKDKKILELGVFSHFIAGHKIENGMLGDGVLRREDFTWIENSSQEIEIRPNGKAKIKLMLINNDCNIAISTFSKKVEEEILFEMELIFKGKYDGENHFREHKEIRAIYCSKEGIAFSNVAVASFSNIDPKMIKALHFVNEGNLYIHRPKDFEETYKP